MFKDYVNAYVDAKNNVEAIKADGERQRQEIQIQATERQKAIIAHCQEEMRNDEIQHAKRMLKIKDIGNLLFNNGSITADTLDQLAKLCKQL